MASPTGLPYRRYRQRSMAGPIILVVIGVFFLLANTHVIAWSNFGHWYARFWPVLIILWGLIKLFEYYDARRRNLPTPGVGLGAGALRGCGGNEGDARRQDVGHAHTRCRRGAERIAQKTIENGGTSARADGARIEQSECTLGAMGRCQFGNRSIQHR